MEDPTSIYNHYKSLIRIRKDSNALKKGKWIEFIGGEDQIIGYFRSYRDENLLILLNFGSRNKTVLLPDGKYLCLFSGGDSYLDNRQIIKEINLRSYQGVILKELL
jgi:glycosidase